MSNREFVSRVLLAILVIGLVLGIWYLRQALMIIFLAFVIAVGLSKPVRMLKKRGVSHTMAILITLGSVFVIFGTLMVVIVPVFAEQVGTLIEELPDAAEAAQEDYNKFASNTGFLPLISSSSKFSEADIQEFLVAQAGSASRSVFPFLSNIGGLVTNFIVVITMSIFILTEPDTYIEGALTLVPRSYRPRALEIIEKLMDAISLSLGAQVFAMFLIGILTMAGLTIIGVPNAVALGVIAGLLNFIPTFGSIIALIIGSIFTLAGAPDKIWLVVAMYLVIQQLESNVITPRIVKQALNMPGAIVISTQIIAGIIFGVLGLILAVPLVAVIMVLVREIYVYDALNSRKAEIMTVERDDGEDMILVSNEPYRPDQMSPGQAAQLTASGKDPFEVAESHTIEIISPPDQTQRAARGQQAVWLAIMALVAAQSIAFIRSLIDDGDKRGA